MYHDKNHIHSLIYFIFIHKTIFKHYPYLKFSYFSCVNVYFLTQIKQKAYLNSNTQQKFLLKIKISGR